MGDRTGLLAMEGGNKEGRHERTRSDALCSGHPVTFRQTGPVSSGYRVWNKEQYSADVGIGYEWNHGRDVIYANSDNVTNQSNQLALEGRATPRLHESRHS